MINATPQIKRRRGRPPKELASLRDSREALIRCGVVALTEKGYSATGLDEILAAADVPKGSFYYYFSSKEQFGAALVERYARYFAQRLDRILLDPRLPPLARLQTFVHEGIAGMARHDYTRGCLVGNLGQEMNALPGAFRQQLLGVFEDWQSRTAACLRAAQQAGQIAPEADCAQLAAAFWIGWEGAVLRARLERRAEPLQLFASLFFAALGHSFAMPVHEKSTL